MIIQILVKEKIFILFHNGDFKIYINNSGSFELEMKFNFSSLKLKKFVFLEQISTFLMINSSGNLFNLYYPSLTDLIEISQSDQQIYVTLSEIENLQIVVTDIYALVDYLILVDDKDIIYYIHVNNLNRLQKKNNEEEGEKQEEKYKIKFIAFEKNYGKILKISKGEDNLMFIDDSYRVK
jgi:hypothetical protein